jgi:hypothetical protein
MSPELVRVIIIHYLCITESVINPTGGATRVGESGRVSAYIFLYKPRLLLVTTNKKFPHVLDKLSVEDNE